MRGGVEREELLGAQEAVGVEDEDEARAAGGEAQEVAAGDAGAEGRVFCCRFDSRPPIVKSRTHTGRSLFEKGRIFPKKSGQPNHQNTRHHGELQLFP